MKNRKHKLVGLLCMILLACTVSITVPVNKMGSVQAASKIKISSSKITICQKKSIQLKITGTSKKVTWGTTRKAVATVTSKGQVTGKAVGTATITAKVQGKIYRCKISVINHTYKNATCTKASACSRCGVKKGKALGHNYSVPTCTKAATCHRCKSTIGKALGHKYDDATCRKAATCFTCGVTKGMPLSHNYRNATCTKPATCTACGVTKGGLLEHNYKEATCTKPATCIVCRATEGGLLNHNYKEATCTQPATCTVCRATEGGLLEHNYKEATCTQPATCIVCRAYGGIPLGHNYESIVVEATKERKGYTFYTCTDCQNTYKDQYTDFQPTANQVCQDILTLKNDYPEGRLWTNDNYYAWKGGIYSGGYGCAGFAFLLSDAAFGYLPARKHTDFDAIKVGDILRINNDGHSVVVLEISNNNVIITEGNYNSSIHWGRTISRATLYENGTYVLTRYPE